MNKNLFEMSDVYAGLDEVIIGCFNAMFSGRNFLDVIEHIVKRHGFNTDGAYCNFPDMNSYDESEHFEGVEFAVGYPLLKQILSLLVKKLAITTFVLRVKDF
nr:ribonuclease toxin immunity protein CdiI [Aeromonas jandaei]